MIRRSSLAWKTAVKGAHMFGCRGGHVTVRGVNTDDIIRCQGRVVYAMTLDVLVMTALHRPVGFD